MVKLVLCVKVVLEHLFPDNWLEKRVGYAFLLGVFYSLIGIAIARLLFGANSGLASVMFTSILIIPSLRKLFKNEEKTEEKERKFTLKKFYTDNKRLIDAYLGMFIGVFVAYFLFSFISMKFGFNVNSIFREQVFLDPAISGRATYSFGTFWNILSNNWWVLLSCFGLSLLSGNGATFFVVWNASAWAVVFAIRAVSAAAFLGKSAVVVGATMTAIITPHMLLEGGAYILAGVAGAVISADIISESKELKKFIAALVGIIVLFVFLNFAFKLILGTIALTIFRILIILGLVYLLRYVFEDKKHQEVFIYNYWLFVFALMVFILGALVETGVLSFSGILANYYHASAMFFA